MKKLLVPSRFFFPVVPREMRGSVAEHSIMEVMSIFPRRKFILVRREVHEPSSAVIFHGKDRFSSVQAGQQHFDHALRAKDMLMTKRNNRNAVLSCRHKNSGSTQSVMTVCL